MIKKIILLGFTLIAFINLSAQNFDWVRTGGGTSFDIANDVTTDDFENVYATGWIKDTANISGTQLISANGQDCYVAKYSFNGTFLWVQQGKGASGNAQGYGVDVDMAGNVYVAGSFKDSINFDGMSVSGFGAFDIFIAKFDNAGNILWLKVAGSSLDDQANDIKVSEDGTVFISGNIGAAAQFDLLSLVTPSGTDMFVAKYSSTGNAIWAVNGGSATTDNAYGMTLDQSENVYVTGYYSGAAMFGSNSLSNSGDDDIYLTKLDSNGNFLWAKGAGGTDQEQGNFVSVDSQKNIYVSGYYTSTSISFGSISKSGSGSSVAFVVKYDSAGNELWVNDFPSTSSSQATGYLVDPIGNAFLSGQFNGELTIGGTTLISGNPSFGWDVLLAKWNSSGVFQWAIKAGGTGFWDTSNGLSVDGGGAVVFGGTFNDGAIFGNDTLPSAGAADFFVARIPGPFLGILESDNLQSLPIYPNPISIINPILNIVMPQGVWEIGVLNLEGKILADFELIVPKPNTEMNLLLPEGLVAGTYLIQVKGEKQSFSHKFLIR